MKMIFIFMLARAWGSSSPEESAQSPVPPRATDEEADEIVVVTGTRTEMRLGDTPVATEVITREDIEASGAEDLATLLEEHPGVDVHRSFLGAEIRLLGLEPDHVLVLVDGQRLPGSKGGVVDLGRLALDRVERVEIVKGPGSALYGSEALAGVINVITRQAPRDPFAVAGRFRYGERKTIDAGLTLDASHGKWAGTLTGAWHGAAPYDLDPSDVATDGSGVRQIDVGGETGIDVTPDWNLGAHASYLWRDLDGVDLGAGDAVFDRLSRIEDFDVGVGTTWRPDARSTLSIDAALSIYRDQYLLDQRGSDALDQYEDTREHLGEVRAQYGRRLGSSHYLVFGADGYAQTLKADRLEGGYGERFRGALFVQDDWDLLDKPRLTVLPGVRVDLDSWFGAWVSPKLSARFDPAKGLVLRASYGLGYRAPDLREMLLHFENPSAGYVVEGNPDLRPERSRGATASVEWAPVKWVSLAVGGFHNDVDDLIDYSTVESEPGEPVAYAYMNIASARTSGLEASARVEMGDAAAVSVSYTLTDTLDRDLDRPLEGRALHRGTASLTGGYAPWGLYGAARTGIVGERPWYLDDDGDGDEDTVMSKPYVTLDLRLSKDIDRYGEVFVGVENLLDVGDADFNAIPPRRIYAGLSGRLAVARRSNPASGGPEHALPDPPPADGLRP